MGAETTKGAAAPAAEGSQTSANGGEFSSDFMKAVFAKKGMKLPSSETTATTDDEKEKKTTTAAEGAGEGEPAAGAEGAEAGSEGQPAGGEGEGEGSEVGQADGEAAPAAAAAATEEQAAETAKVVNAKLKDLPEPQRKLVQAIIDERIGKISAKSKTETERLGNRVVELTTELETTRKKTGGTVVVPGVHPAMLLSSPEELDAYTDQLDAQENALDSVRETGVEADEAKGQPGYTPEQIRARLREIQRERERILPQARTLIQKRAESSEAIKKAYPDLFDPKTEEYRMADSIRKMLPELQRLPNADEFIAKLVLGTKVITADASKAAAGKKTAQAAAPGKTTTKPATTARKAPRAPGDGSGALGSVLDDPRQQQADTSGAVSNFTKTRSRTDLKTALRGLVFS